MYYLIDNYVYWLKQSSFCSLVNIDVSLNIKASLYVRFNTSLFTSMRCCNLTLEQNCIAYCV